MQFFEECLPPEGAPQREHQTFNHLRINSQLYPFKDQFSKIIHLIINSHIWLIINPNKNVYILFSDTQVY